VRDEWKEVRVGTCVCVNMRACVWRVGGEIMKCVYVCMCVYACVNICTGVCVCV